MGASFDTIVIGKGMMGASAARHLAAGGQRVALIGPDEPKDWATHERVFSSHYDNGRITRTIDRDADWARLARRSIERYTQIEGRSGIRFYSEVGCLIVSAAGGAYLADVEAAAGSLGVAIDRLDGHALSQRFSGFAFAKGSAGIFEARDAGHINPRAFVAAQTVCAILAGVTLVSEAVDRVDDGDGCATVTTVSGKAFSAAKVLIATGGFSLSKSLVNRPVCLAVKARTVLFAEVGPDDLDRLGTLPSLIVNGASEAESFYLLPPILYPNGRTYIKIGGDPDDVVLSSEPEIRAWYRSGGRSGAADHLRRHLDAVMPDFTPASTHFAPCVVTMTETGYPYIGWLDGGRTALLTGGNGMAAKSADEIGRLGASLILEGALDAEDYASDFSPRFA